MKTMNGRGAINVGLEAGVVGTAYLWLVPDAQGIEAIRL